MDLKGGSGGGLEMIELHNKYLCIFIFVKLVKEVVITPPLFEPVSHSFTQSFSINVLF